MPRDFCMDCGALLPPRQNTCPVCGFSPFVDLGQDVFLDKDFLEGLTDEFTPDEISIP